tara:strand:+ start:320 stop:748 length:429 start_codon:yes stop_codon:yes gene_type:complete
MYSLFKSISSKKINFKSNSDLFFNSKFKIAIILFSIFIGALNSDLTAQESKTTDMEDDQTVIYCKPDIVKCLENLENLKQWLLEDYKDQIITNKTHDEYHLVVTHTISSLEMILENKGQCDTSNDRENFRYSTPDISEKANN